MKFILVAVASLAALVRAQLPAFTNSQYDVQSGQPFTLTFTGCTSSCTILLKAGPTSDLQTVLTLTTDASGGTFTWTPPSGLASGTYAFEIEGSSGVNYSPQFTYSGNPTGTIGLLSSTAGATITSGSSSASASATTTTASSASTTGSSSSKSTTSSASTTSTQSSASTTTSPSSSSTKAPTNTNDGRRFASPLAFILVTVAALVYFN